MSNAYMIETSGEIAGVVVREGRRFRFLSSSPRFWNLDGEHYRNPKEAERAALALLAVLRAETSAPPCLSSSPGQPPSGTPGFAGLIGESGCRIPFYRRMLSGRCARL